MQFIMYVYFLEREIFHRKKIETIKYLSLQSFLITLPRFAGKFH